MPTRKGEAAKRRIVDAAWELSDRRGVEALLGGVTLRQIAREVEMTPSAIGYHFPSMRDLAFAMVERHVELGAATETVFSVQAHLDGLAEEFARNDVASLVFAAARSNWAALTTDDEVRFERRHARCFAAAVDATHGDRVAAMLDDTTGLWHETLSRTYQRAAERAGLRPIAPFDFDDLALVGMALASGLLQSWATDPGRVRTDLLPQAFTAFTSALLVEDPQRVTLDEVGARLSRRDDSPLDAALDPADAERVAELVGDGVDGVSLSDAAEVLGVTASTVAREYGSVRRLAALSFGRHVAAVTDAVQRRAEDGPLISLTDGVYELSRWARAEPHTATALAQERLLCALATSPRLGTVRRLHRGAAGCTARGATRAAPRRTGRRHDRPGGTAREHGAQLRRRRTHAWRPPR